MTALTDEEKLAALQRKHELALEQRRHDLVELMRTSGGRRIAYSIWQVRLEDSFGLEAADPNGRADAFREGRRSLAKQLCAELQRAAPREWVLMVDEAVNRERNEAAEKA